MSETRSVCTIEVRRSAEGPMVDDTNRNTAIPYVIFDPFDCSFMDEHAAWGVLAHAERFDSRESAEKALAEVHAIYPECVVLTFAEAERQWA